MFRLTILHTNDWHGVLDNLPMYATYVRAIREQEENVLLLDGGDIFRRGPFEDLLGEAEIAVMNAMGYDALTLGNTDFPRRARELSDFSQHPITRYAGFPVLCANVTVDGEFLPGVMPYTIINTGGLDIAIIGVTSMKPYERDEFVAQWADFTEPEIALAEQLEHLNGVTDIQIALSHAGIDADRRMRGVSAIIGADNHLWFETPEVITDGGLEIPIVQAGGENRHYLGKLDLTFAEIDGVWLLQRFSGELLNILGVPPDPEILRIIEYYTLKVLDGAA
jgi:5'-nucleotidase